jgi:hypothetical protein
MIAEVYRNCNTTITINAYLHIYSFRFPLKWLLYFDNLLANKCNAKEVRLFNILGSSNEFLGIHIFNSL